MDPFGEYSVHLDPWDADYGSELPIAAGAEGPTSSVTADTTVEVGGAWNPVAPAPESNPGEIVFVDGVRRADARLLIARRAAPDGPVVAAHGAFGTFAVGAVRVAGTQASWSSSEVGRVLATGGGVTLGVVPVTKGVVYRPLAVADSDPEAPLRALQAAMRSAEERIALGAVATADLVVVDGPLPFSLFGAVPARDQRGHAVGLVKRIHELYVGPQAAVLPRLGLGERSPLFAMRAANHFERFSWYVRLALPGRSESPMTGLVRLEVSERAGFEQARKLADVTARILPRFVPSRARDPRAPQNLLPIGALETHLRRLLGDRRLLRRHIQTLLARASSRAPAPAEEMAW